MGQWRRPVPAVRHSGVEFPLEGLRLSKLLARCSVEGWVLRGGSL